MGFLSKTLNKNQNSNNCCDESSNNTKKYMKEKETTMKGNITTVKEIDWEERHFQICLALIQGEATKPATPSLPYQSIVKMADKMINVLKKRLEQPTVEPASAKG